MDLQKACENYFKDENPREQFRGINLNKLSLEVVPGTVTWDIQRNGNSNTSESYQVRVDRNETNTSASSTIGSTNTMQLYVQCELNQGQLKGINTPLRVPLDAQLDVFGNSVDINIGKSPSENHMNVPVTVTAERPFGPGARSDQATVSVHTTQMTATFRCQAKLRGKVVVQQNSGHSEFRVGKVADRLGNGFERRGDEIFFTVSGNCQFQLGNHGEYSY